MTVIRTQLPDRCVYIMFRETGTPFYVGKGRRDRPNDHLRDAKRGRNTHKLNIVRKLLRIMGEVPTVIIAENLTDEEATSVERALIAAIGRVITGDGPLVNLTIGGEGTRGYKYTAAQIETLTAAQTNSDVQARRLAAVMAAWANPILLAKQSALQREIQNRPDVKKRQRARVKVRMNNPITKLPIVAALQAALAKPEILARRTASLRKTFAKPEVKEKFRATTTASWQDPHIRAKRIAGLHAAILRKQGNAE